MNLAPFNSKEPLKTEIEALEVEKQEYKLLGSYILTKGLRLYSYNSLKNELLEVEPTGKPVVNIFDVDNEAFLKADVDSRNEHFEALNKRSALKRIDRWKKGIVKDLCNLRDPNKVEKLKIY